MRTLMLLTGLIALAGCATGAGERAVQREAASLARYEAAAGEPVRSFRYFRIDHFVALGDSALAVWTTQRTAWLLTVDRGCPELQSSMAIGIDGQFNRVYVNSDAIVVPQGRCVVRSIREVDVAALRASERAAREPVGSDGSAGRDATAGQPAGGT